jgi:catechol 2,3-dioxygenase-like lactoylglutathione lyase family enzyme
MIDRDVNQREKGCPVIGRLSSVVFDCADPHALARFYSELLGWPVIRVDGNWVDIGDGQSRLSFQLAPEEPGFRVYADPAGHPFCLEWKQP